MNQPESPSGGGSESMVSSASNASLSSSPVTMAELEFADHLSHKIRLMNASGATAAPEPSDDALQLREQAFRTMQELQQGIHTSDNPFGVASDMLAVKHAMFDSCFKGASLSLRRFEFMCVHTSLHWAPRRAHTTAHQCRCQWHRTESGRFV